MKTLQNTINESVAITESARTDLKVVSKSQTAICVIDEAGVFKYEQDVLDRLTKYVKDAFKDGNGYNFRSIVVVTEKENAHSRLDIKFFLRNRSNVVCSFLVREDGRIISTLAPRPISTYGFAPEAKDYIESDKVLKNLYILATNEGIYTSTAYMIETINKAVNENI